MSILVFAASPLRGKTPEEEKQNIEYVRDKCKRLYKTRKEVAFAPHLYFTQFLDDQIEEERQAGMKFGLQIMDLCCDKMYVFGDRITEGMTVEIEFAIERGIKIEYVPDPEEFFAPKSSRPPRRWWQTLRKWLVGNRW